MNVTPAQVFFVLPPPVRPDGPDRLLYNFLLTLPGIAVTPLKGVFFSLEGVCFSLESVFWYLKGMCIAFRNLEKLKRHVRRNAVTPAEVFFFTCFFDDHIMS